MKTLPIQILPLVVAMLATQVSGSHAGSFDYGLSPKLLSSSQADDTTLGLEYSVEGRQSAGRTLPAGIGDLGFDVRAKSEGTVALDKDVNPNPLVTTANLDLRLTTGSAAPDDFNGDPDANPEGAKDRNYFGDLILGLSGRHEADQSFDEQLALLGFEAAYINTQDNGIWSFVPSVRIAYEWGDAFESDIREDLGVEDSSFRRWRVDGSIKARLGRYLVASGMWRTLTLHLEAQYFRCEGQPEALSTVDLDDALYTAAALSVRQDMKAVGFKSRLYFVRISNGRPPPLANGDDDIVVSLGVRVTD
jgi:hypothetical protein